MSGRSDGFTLIELLVSMTVLALLMVLLFGGLRFGTRAWEQSDATGNASQDIRSVQGLLRMALERICPRRLAASAPAVPIVDFTGTSHAMFFLGPQPKSLGENPCARLGIGVDGHSGTRLVLTLTTTTGFTERSLLDDVNEVEFAYLGVNGWQESWSGRAGLPRIVRIRLHFPNGDARIWPELYVAPHISAENDCAYNFETKMCQGS